MALRNRFTVLYSAAAGICFLAMCPGLQAQQDDTSRILASVAVKDDLQPVKTSLLRIDQCRVQLPADSLKDRFTEAETQLAEGLLIGWRERSSWPPIPQPFAAIASRYYQSPSTWVAKPPSLYLQSLQNDAEVCNRAVMGDRDPAAFSSLLQAVIADLIVKARDCYSQGMGRLVGIQVTTKRGKTPDPGWTVYYKWISVSDIPTAETPFQTSSTPAKDNLPPGIYQLRAEKTVPGSSNILRSEVKMVPLDTTHDRCELQVP